MSKFRYEYIWIDADNNLRSKSRVFNQKNSINSLPIWNFDGSSTGQAPGIDSEVYLNPVKIYVDPFSYRNNDKEDNYDFLVLCETINDDLKTPHSTNMRNQLYELSKLDNVITQIPWFGFELEFFMMNRYTNLPLGFNKEGGIPEQGKFYCGNGADSCFGRNIMNEFYDSCLKSGVNIVGINAEVACGQWEYQIFGDTLNATDDAWMSKYILNRVAEYNDVVISWHPKPIEGDCNGSGMHTNFSTVKMREDGGLEEIINTMPKLELSHKEHLEVYGKDNDKRLTGEHETASIDTFTWGYGDRGSSIRIGKMTQLEKKGYFEDRRPASSSDVYLVAHRLIKTICC